MTETKKEPTYQPISFDAIKIGLASPEKILEWSRGEVTKPETINYRTLKPERDGLFCEKIFGPSKDWECHCGKYKKIRYKGVVCDRCGVEVTKATVRRERMGHIALAAPVSHIWYFKGIPSRMGLILDLSPRTLEKVLYFASYIVLDKGETDLSYKQVLSEAEYQEARENWGNGFRVGMGAEAIKELLEAIDLEKDYAELQAGLEGATGQKRARIVKRLEVVEAFRESGNKPEWMIMTAIPVIPPDLRTNPADDKIHCPDVYRIDLPEHGKSVLQFAYCGYHPQQRQGERVFPPVSDSKSRRRDGFCCSRIYVSQLLMACIFAQWNFHRHFFCDDLFLCTEYHTGKRRK